MAQSALSKKVKQIPEQKLKAFSIGSMGNRTLSKKEIEEQKKREQEKAAAQAFEEYVATFQEAPSKTGKVWVKAGTYDAGKRHEDTKDRGKLYKPQPRVEVEKEKGTATEKAQEYAKLLSERSKPERPGKKKERDKKKSNLELFKEELKLIQEEREERHKYKGAIKNNLVDPEIIKSASGGEEKGSFDAGDPNTTNIYLGNISPKCTEEQLMELFGKHGPLASIKIMWPRSDEEKSRGRNCGFVAFMSRRDGERAMKALNGKEIMGYEMKLGWGKAIHIPSYPIYIPPALLQITAPPPPSGLPFSAQPHPRDKNKVPKMRANEPYAENPDDQRLVEEILPQALVKVVIPSDRNLLMLIHHMIEFVIREGPMFEAMIMNREINNPNFRFLFDNQNPQHLYYRWKMFSLLQGDTQKEWRLSEFRMFKGGPIWRPPQPNIFTQGMPEELVEKDDERKGGLSPAQRDRLEQLIRRTTPGRLRVADAMVFCIEHADAADEICDVIVESLSNANTLLHKKIARLYLVSDILHNCGLKITNASVFRRCLECRLPDIFRQVHDTMISLESRLKAEAFKVRVLKIFQAWGDWAIYPRDFLTRLKATFLGTSTTPELFQEEPEESDNEGSKHEDLDDDLDGVPLDGAALLKTAMMINNPPPPTDDIDGIPVDDDIDGKPLEDLEEGSKNSSSLLFVPSKWETVDPSQIEEQAMTTSKWELLEQREKEAREAEEKKRRLEEKSSPEDTIEEEDSVGSSRDIQEEIRRAKLREVEVKVMQYQDELESGKKNIKSGWTLSEMVEHHRKKLLRKIDKEKDKTSEKRKNSPSPDDLPEPKHKKSRRSRSSSYSPPRKTHRSRSRSAGRYRPDRGESRERRRARSRSNSRSRSRTSPVRSRRGRTPSPDPSPPRSSRRQRTPSPIHSQRSSKHSSKKHKHKHRH